MTQWSLWVLDHGSPPLPIGSSSGSDTGRLMGRAIGGRPSCTFRPRLPTRIRRTRCFDTEIECFRRVDGEWNVANATGGTDWPPGASLTRFEAAPLMWASAVGDGEWRRPCVDSLRRSARHRRDVDRGERSWRGCAAPDRGALGIVVVGVAHHRPVTIRFSTTIPRTGSHIVE